MHRRFVALVGLAVVVACSPSAAVSPSRTFGEPTAGASADPPNAGDLVVVGRIVTMGEPPIAEAMLIEDGIVAAVGGRAEVLERAGDGVPVMDLGSAVAYPGFIDAHAHWIGDRDYYGVATAAEAIDLALRRGWTSISEQWVNPERLRELEALAAEGALPVRVDAYLALNYEREFLGDWYAEREHGDAGDRLRVRGVKVHLDHGLKGTINWDRAELMAAIDRADDAGWQVSVHAARAEAMELVLDAYEAALGPAGPNPLHHRIEHAIQVTDEQLARMATMDLATVIHLDGAADWVIGPDYLAQFERDEPGAENHWVARWRDFLDAGLHVASATDAPWTFPDFSLPDDLGRPVDHIAAGTDGRTRTSAVTPPWLLDQLLTAEESLRAVTVDAAWALGDEARRGRLAPGMLGDVTVLTGDVTAATPAEIRAMEVVATIVGGVAVHCATAGTCGR